MAGADVILCDTNILIEFYKGRAEVIETLRGIGSDELAVSVVTMGELFYRARDRRTGRVDCRHCDAPQFAALHT